LETLYDYLKPSIPADHCRQSRATELVMARIRAGFKAVQVLDLGCGAGNTIDFFKKCLPDAKWVGVDIEESPEVAQRRRNDAEFVTFDGVNLPFADGQFDLIFSNQVLEHARLPEQLLAQVHRVLSPDGLFIGQTSQLEPYHSFSYWNFTVFGFKIICEAADLELIELRPGIDGMTLTKRAYLGRPAEYSKWSSHGCLRQLLLLRLLLTHSDKVKQLHGV
jgi:ubiquinone/menaquinone biosynthesis C-methylase UbiE